MNEYNGELQMTVKTIKAEFNKSARVISDYENDLIFEQPRAGLISQTLTTYENMDIGVKKTVTTRLFTSNGDYNDQNTISILPNNL